MGAYPSLVAVLVAAGAGVAAAAVYLMARGLVRPPRMTDGKALYLLNRLTPRDLGLAFEPVAFRVRDGRAGLPLTLAAWWIPVAAGGAPAGRTVVLVHGYADAKVGALAWVPAWHGMGFDVLAVDLRAHGESDGTVCSAGFHERHDLVQVVHQLVAERPAAGRTLVLFGASMGAAVVAAAADLLNGEDSDRPTAGGEGTVAAARPVVAGVVLESPFADFRSAAAAHLDRLGLPGGWVRRAAVALAARLAAADFAAVRPADVVRRLRCPVWVLAAGDDAYMSAAEAAEIERAVAARPAGAGDGAYVRFDGVEHLMAVVDAPDEYRAALRVFAGHVAGRSR
jgi:pimeloyl-ACP methyl ester carboxylesterase